MSKFNYKFRRLIGACYSGGNTVFSRSGDVLLSPVGNRVTEFDLLNCTARTVDVELRSSVRCVAVTSDDRIMIAIDETNHGVLVNLRSGAVLHRFAFKKNVRCVAFSPNDRHFAVSHGNHVQVWRTPLARRDFAPFVLHGTYTGQQQEVTHVCWDKKGEFLLSSSSDNTARVFSLSKIDKFRATTLAGQKESLVGSFFAGEGGTIIYTVSRDGAVFTWNWRHDQDDENEDHDEDEDKDKEPVKPLVGGSWALVSRHFFNQERAKVSGVSMDANGKLLVVGFTTGVFGLYSMPSCSNIHSLSVSSDAITSVSMSPSGDWLSFGCPILGQLLVWEWQSETYVLKQQGHGYAMNAMRYSPDEQCIATGGEDGKVKMWSSSSGFCFVTFDQHTAPVRDVTFANPGVVLSASLDGTVRAFDLVRYKNFKTMTTPEPVQFMCVSSDPSGEIVAAGCMDPFDVYLWSLQTGKILDVLSGHKGPVTSLKFSPVGGNLASGSWDRTVKIWDCYKNDVMETLQHSFDVVCLDWRPDGKNLVVGTLSGSLDFWDAQEGELMFSIDGQRDISGGRKENDRMVAANNSSSRHFTSVAYSADWECVLAGGNSKYICIYAAASQVLLKKFQISHSRSLDGTLDFLNSKFMADGGPISEIQEAGDDEDARKMGAVTNLPGAKRMDDGSRKSKREVKTSCIGFSGTGTDFAAVTTEGLLVWSLDSDMVFDPVALTEEVTPSAVASNIAKGLHGQALAMALLLNENNLIEAAVDGVPNGSIPLVCRGISREHFDRFLQFLAKKVASTPHIEFYLNWLLAFSKAHAGALEGSRGVKHRSSLKSLFKAVKSRQLELRVCLNENAHVCRWTAASLESELKKLTGAGDGIDQAASENLT